ncbi:hypothetical protein Acj9p058 [Acinetobacter phage Acj9]|uniref:Uncharacterized protein n=1 Tax=Acinetobacter phage Acj9 TaxID=760939 RepID=E5EPJ2_9CAUD|nr:hypothetical protein Acj9p058 [Acinetobacter phage Acj9]ADG59958.1 hypothetical protein Acj9p058 [Acinetobacter phage Acj9]
MNTINVTSRTPPGVHLDFCTDFEYCNISNMCIKQAGHSEYQIPANIEHIVWEAIAAVHELNEQLYNDDWLYNCYLTLKHEYVNPSSTGTRPGWHIDGFMSDQKNFIWSDCLPTQVALGDFKLSLHHDLSLHEMERDVRGRPIVQLASKMMYELDQEVVHAPVVNETSSPILRTFLKLTYTKDEFNCARNAWNYKLPNVRGFKTPGASRNHGVL